MAKHFYQASNVPLLLNTVIPIYAQTFFIISLELTSLPNRPLHQSSRPYLGSPNEWNLRQLLHFMHGPVFQCDWLVSWVCSNGFFWEWWKVYTSWGYLVGQEKSGTFYVEICIRGGNGKILMLIVSYWTKSWREER